MNYHKLCYEIDREKMMNDFIKNDCVACGGNWSAMLISGIKRRFWWLYDEMEDDRQYDFFELADMVYTEIDARIANNIRENNDYMRENIANRMMEYGKVIGHENRSNEYVGCDTYVIQYLGQYFELHYVDGMLTHLLRSTAERGIEIALKAELRRYE